MKRFLWLMLIVLLFGCAKDNGTPKLKETEYILYAKDTQNVKGINLKGVEWESNYPFVATMEGNAIIANHVGTATVTNEEHKMSFKVTVEPKYQIFSSQNSYDKYFDFYWSELRGLIKSKLGTPDIEDSNNLGYNTGESAVYAMVYSFVNERLDYVAMGVKTTYLEELTDFLTERYTPYVTVSNNEFSFAKQDNSGKPIMLVYVSVQASSTTVIFRKVTTKSCNENIVLSIMQLLMNK